MHPSRKTAIILLTIALVGGGALSLLFLAEKDENESGPPVKVTSPYGLFSPGTLDGLPPGAARTMLQTLGMDSLTPYQDYSLGLVKEVGVSWVRINFVFDGWSFLEAADYLNKLHNAGLQVVGTATIMNRFAPADLTVFKTEFGKLIRRYPWITIWQIGNEPNISWENPDDYPRFFLAGRELVRDTCSTCRVALAGFAARYPSQISDSLDFEIYDNIVSEIVRKAPADGHPPFDIFDLHYYGFYDSQRDVLQTIRNTHGLLSVHGVDINTDFWVTETATTSGQPAFPPEAPPQTEDQQAAELVERFTAMLSEGVSHVSWSRPYENYRYTDDEGSFYNYAGLIYNGLGQEEASGIKAGTKKKAFYAYQTLVARTAAAVEVQRLALGQYRFSFRGSRSPVYVLWSDSAAALPDEITGPVNVTDLMGKQRQTMAEDLSLGPMPVFVESRPLTN